MKNNQTSLREGNKSSNFNDEFADTKVPMGTKMIYVLGSINLDLVFEVGRMPKAGETFKSQGVEIFYGGKGANQAVAVAKLGSKVRMIGCVGSDAFSKNMKQSLDGFGVDTRFVFEHGNVCGMAAIFRQSGENRIVIAEGANGMLSTSDVDLGLKDAKENDILLCQLETPIEIVSYALRLAKEKRMVTILNPAPAIEGLPQQVYENTDIIAPNETETKILTGIDPIDIVHVALAVKKLYSFGVKNVILTLGAKGACVASGMNITEIEALRVKVVDTTAAGDTFIGTVCNRLEAGFDLVEACRFATCASSITIQRKGAAISIPTIDEVESIYKTNF